jgi:hypothetical protein
MNLHNMYVPLLSIVLPSHQITTYLPVEVVITQSNSGA